MKVLNKNIQIIIESFEDSSFPLTEAAKEKVRLERERILTLNKKIYNRTRMLKLASTAELKEYEINKELIKRLKDIQIEDGASF
jgi:chaperonin GroEL (HSP60 family)